MFLVRPYIQIMEIKQTERTQVFFLIRFHAIKIFDSLKISLGSLILSRDEEGAIRTNAKSLSVTKYFHYFYVIIFRAMSFPFFFFFLRLENRKSKKGRKCEKKGSSLNLCAPLGTNFSRNLRLRHVCGANIKKARSSTSPELRKGSSFYQLDKGIYEKHPMPY